MLKNYIIALYQIPSSSLLVKLFDNKYSNILSKIDKLIIDNKEIEPVEYYKFDKKGIHSICFLFKHELDSMQNLFCDCFYLIQIDFSNLLTSKVKNMSCLFQRCSSLEYVEFKNVNTSNVEDMQKMFFGCGKLKEVDLTMFNTTKVKNMSNLFNSCSSLICSRSVPI